MDVQCQYDVFQYVLVCFFSVCVAMVLRDMYMGLEQIRPYVPTLNQHLAEYLLLGGTPKVVNEYLVSGLVKEGIFKTRLDVIMGDLQFMNRSENTFKQLACSAVKVAGSTSSWKSLQKDADICSPTTVASYVDTPQNMLILSVFHQYDIESKRRLY